MKFIDLEKNHRLLNFHADDTQTHIHAHSENTGTGERNSLVGCGLLVINLG